MRRPGGQHRAAAWQLVSTTALAVSVGMSGCRDRLREPLHALTPPLGIAPSTEAPVVPIEAPAVPIEAPAVPEAIDMVRLYDLSVPIGEPELVALASAPDLRVRRIVAQRLARSGAIEAPTVAALALLARDEAAAVRYYALAALVATAVNEAARDPAAALPPAQETLNALTPQLPDEDSLNLVAALSSADGPYAIARLEGLLTHPADTVAIHAAGALMGREGVSIDALTAALRDPRPAVSCAAARVLAYSPALAQELPGDAVSGDCYAPLLARRGDLTALSCAQPVAFAAADESTRRSCIETVLASETPEAERIVFGWLTELPDRIDAATLDELAPIAPTRVEETALERLGRDPGDAVAMLAVARFGGPRHTEQLRALQTAASAADPALGERYSSIIDAIQRRHESP